MIVYSGRAAAQNSFDNFPLVFRTTIAGREGNSLSC